jgi:hypothetical protein
MVCRKKLGFPRTDTSLSHVVSWRNRALSETRSSTWPMAFPAPYMALWVLLKGTSFTGLLGTMLCRMRSQWSPPHEFGLCLMHSVTRR